jgi:hypothetical protein
MGLAWGDYSGWAEVWRAEKLLFFLHKRLAYTYTVYIIGSTADH